MSEMTISSIELEDLQGQVAALTDGVILATQDPIGAAESVCRALLVRISEKTPLSIPECHSLAPDPMGFDADASECRACFDKLTCMMGVHRQGRERVPIRVQGVTINPVNQETAGLRVPVAGILVVSDPLMNLSNAHLVERAIGMGAMAHKGMSKRSLVNIINRAKNEKHVIIDVKPEKKAVRRVFRNTGKAPGKINAARVEEARAKVESIDGSSQRHKNRIRRKKLTKDGSPKTKKAPKMESGAADWVKKSGYEPGTFLEPAFAKYMEHGAVVEVMAKEFILRMNGKKTHCKNLREALKRFAKILGIDIPNYSGNKFWKAQ